MKILLAGASGMVGSTLTFHLRARGHNVVPLVRPPRIAGPGEVAWNPQTGELDAAQAASADAVVNLAGASIGEGRWSDVRKQLIRSSRVDFTRALVDAVARLSPPPKVFVSASAVGYYGNRGDEPLDEESPPGNGFLANLVRDWERQTQRATEAGMRTVILRFGVILSARGGALAQMLGPFRLGVGGRLGSGRQWMPWVALTDVVRIVQGALENPEWQGVYNTVAPQAVTNAEFTRALGKTLSRPTLLPVPPFALRILFGEMADEMLLSSQRVVPRKLDSMSYSYLYRELEPALRSALSNS